MAGDAILPVRRAALKALKAATGVTALVPAARIYPGFTPGEPMFPFIRHGSPSSRPISAACVDGSEVEVTFHAFAKARMASGVEVETGEDLCMRIARAVSAALHRRRLELDGGGTARLTRIETRIMPDGSEADAWHAVIRFRARAL